ncbi:MAG: NUDIX domain-containing protein [Erysipelotrichaceae bacterium]|nr:NUDIX domain-containing protein [Erysipelotrichaceae bacterium]
MTEISAGAIVYTLIDEQINYLLTLDFHGNWGFPKGHLEAGESEEEAALREIEEEAGVKVELDKDFRHPLEYVMPNGRNKVSVYFLGFYEDQKPVPQPEEVAEIRLLPYEEAFQLLTFDNMKEVLVEAHGYLNHE